jgi:AraC-like DNA-binding protein
MQTIYGKQSSEVVAQPRPLPLFCERTTTVSANLTQPKQVAEKPSADRARQADMSLVEALSHSTVYREYAHAFTEATGLPVALRSVESWQLPLHGKRHESPYCALISEKSRACASCLQMQEKLSQAAVSEPRTMICSAGLCETAVPVRLGDRLIGFLQTGQVFRQKPTAAQFERTSTLLAERGVEVNRSQVRDAYFATRVMPRKQQESATTLLRIFAQHLSMLSNHVMVQQQNAELPVITKAKAYIEEHHTEEVGLGQVAKAVNMSTFYFCKMFKKVTGINFTGYLSRVRMEKAKNLLLNPNLRISEIAFEVGFQSLTHFNRVFKKLLGESPTEYRAQLMGA